MDADFHGNSGIMKRNSSNLGHLFHKYISYFVNIIIFQTRYETDEKIYVLFLRMSNSSPFGHGQSKEPKNKNKDKFWVFIQNRGRKYYHPISDS